MATTGSSEKSIRGRAAGTRSSNRQSTEAQRKGGREFGQLIEPMQVQMASGNCGLAEDAGEPPAEPQQEAA
jgi:hypothetical protein